MVVPKRTLCETNTGTVTARTLRGIEQNRGFPSARCMFPSEMFLCTDAGSWQYDPAAHELRPVGTPCQGDPPTTASDATALVIAARPGKLPGYYRELRWSLSLCEAGHLIGLTLALAAALGMTPRLRTDFDDQALLARLNPRVIPLRSGALEAAAQ